jgi:DHA1 family multidrug resistance protein-like MFS transporter
VKDVVQRYIFRPAQMIPREPILLLVTIYMALIYGILYLVLKLTPSVFRKSVAGMKGWEPYPS